MPLYQYFFLIFYVFLFSVYLLRLVLLPAALSWASVKGLSRHILPSVRYSTIPLTAPLPWDLQSLPTVELLLQHPVSPASISRGSDAAGEW